MPRVRLLCVLTRACCVQEEEEVPDDETVNQMIARSEEEFDHFMVSVCGCVSLHPSRVCVRVVTACEYISLCV